MALLIGRGAFSFGSWLRLEEEVGAAAEGMLLLSAMAASGEAGVEIYVRRVRRSRSTDRRIASPPRTCHAQQVHSGATHGAGSAYA